MPNASVWCATTSRPTRRRLSTRPSLPSWPGAWHERSSSSTRRYTAHG
jgi:hypothetical protein